MTNPLPVVTAEMREAVYADDCKRTGHILDIDNAYQISDEDNLTGNHAPDIMGNDDETFAYLTCRRCHRVWIVLEDSGKDYDEAVKKFQNILKKANMDKDVKPKRKDAKKPHNHGVPPVTPAEEIGTPKPPKKERTTDKDGNPLPGVPVHT